MGPTQNQEDSNNTMLKDHGPFRKDLKLGCTGLL